MLKGVDQWGGPETYPHRTTAAAVRAFAVGVTGGKTPIRGERLASAAMSAPT